MHLFNTLTRKKEEFLPRLVSKVTMYSCGPTVYNTAHVGNLRAFLFADTLQRWLRFGKHYAVEWVMNITDIDDKTIRDSKLQYPEKTPLEALSTLTQYYEKLFFADLEAVGIEKKHFLGNPHATEYISQMQSLIQKIVDNGYGYIADCSVYLSIREYRKDFAYGELVSLDFDNMKTGSRVENDEYDKESLSDFVLWKGKKEGEPFWEYEVKITNKDTGIVETVSLAGRPGWHIECSAMSASYFDDFPFDIHTGGVDLCFPHHEDEICQMRAGEGKDTSRFWCHNEYLMVDGKKMSKSLGNFYLLSDILAKGFLAEDLRFFMVTNHYQTKLNLSDESLKMAKNTLDNLRQMVAKVSIVEVSLCSVSLAKKEFEDAMNDNLNVSVALAAVYGFLKKAVKEGIASDQKQEFDNFVLLVEDVFGVKIAGIYTLLSEVKDETIVSLLAQMNEARALKDWQMSDVLRDKISQVLAEKGILVVRG